MGEKYLIKISVRELVEFILRGGDIDNRRTAPMDVDAMQEGSRIHRKIQSRMGSGYRAEVPLKYTIETEQATIVLDGRADGIYEKDNCIVIDEIKGVYRKLEYMEEPVKVHLAQAKCYAYIYLTEENLEEIGVCMTYCNMDTEEIKRFPYVYSREEITEWFDDLLSEYLKWVNFQAEARERRNISVKQLEFPFQYREGQRDAAVSVYRAIRDSQRLFIQAPTGIGKTMATMFPSVKSMGENLTEKIFYLTAKTTTRGVAEEAASVLRQKGARLMNVTITAKEKICPLEECRCNPEECEYAKGHFDRVNAAIYEIITTELEITRDKIVEYGKKHKVCPFELCLDVTLFSDIIICDYNYLFDPTASLKRFFAGATKENYTFLIDEAHNLLDRAREMYSAVLVKEQVLEVKKILGTVIPSTLAIFKNLNKCNRILLEYKRQSDGENELPEVDDLILPLMRIQPQLEKLLDDHKEFQGRDKVLDFYFDVRTFLNIYDEIDSNYEIYTSFTEQGEFFLKLFCMNPSRKLREYMDKGRSTILFSATMLPVNYYKKLLSGEVNDFAIYINSPFPKNNRRIMVAKDVSTKYTRRTKEEYEKIYDYIRIAMRAKAGNYMVFFPSYRVMEQVYEIAMREQSEYEFLIQGNAMSEQDREEFLHKFQPGKQVVGFCVLGGVFSEGIDLKFDSLIGSIIVGTGLPQICKEREILRKHFSEVELVNGFDYAYRFVGMNKVLQSAGRVIRTMQDVGIVLLLDERFMEPASRKLFPMEWDDVVFLTRNSMEKELEDFWKKMNEEQATEQMIE